MNAMKRIFRWMSLGSLSLIILGGLAGCAVEVEDDNGEDAEVEIDVDD
jgi:hypothetical protein